MFLSLVRVRLIRACHMRRCVASIVAMHNVVRLRHSSHKPVRGAPADGPDATTNKPADEVHGTTKSVHSAAGAESEASSPSPSPSSPDTQSSQEEGITSSNGKENVVANKEPEPERWLQMPYSDPDLEPIIDEKGNFIVSKVKWPTGEVAYTTPPPPDTRIAPRFGYNVLQVKKDVSWWKHYQKYPRLSLAYLNIQFFFLIFAAWLVAFLMTEYRKVTEEMKTPGAMVGEHRGRGPVTKGTQKVSFTQEEMTALIGNAQNNWMDSKGEAAYVGSKDYRMKQISRPKEFSVEDFRKR